ncbi:MAG TPA: PEP-CTERM sorting domain-containing protein [Opitutaceae bacterium]
MKLSRFISLAAALSAASLSAQVSLSSLTNLTYSEDFNSLPFQTTTNPTPADTFTKTTFNEKLPGWFVSLGSTTGSDVAYNGLTGDGVQSSSTIPTLRNYGNTNSSDRALGLYVGTSTLLASGALGLVFENDTGLDVTSFSLGYTGEEWRRATDGRLEFQYQIVSSFDGGTYNFRTATGWIDGDSLDFAAPVTGTGSGLDGNASANRSPFSPVTFNVDLAANEFLLIRWYDNTRAGMAIDDLTVSFTAVSAIPEPSTYAAIAGVLALGAVVVIRRRRQS